MAAVLNGTRPENPSGVCIVACVCLAVVVEVGSVTAIHPPDARGGRQSYLSRRRRVTRASLAALHGGRWCGGGLCLVGRLAVTGNVVQRRRAVGLVGLTGGARGFVSGAMTGVPVAWREEHPEDIGRIGGRTEHVEGAGDLPDGYAAAICGGCDALERVDRGSVALREGAGVELLEDRTDGAAEAIEPVTAGNGRIGHRAGRVGKIGGGWWLVG